VQVVSIEQKDVPIYGEWLPLWMARECRHTPAGGGVIIMKQTYREGTTHKGEVLFEIDPRPLRPCCSRHKQRQAEVNSARPRSMQRTRRWQTKRYSTSSA
jgi:hypothetical protein